MSATNLVPFSGCDLPCSSLADSYQTISPGCSITWCSCNQSQTSVRSRDTCAPITAHLARVVVDLQRPVRVHGLISQSQMSVVVT